MTLKRHENFTDNLPKKPLKFRGNEQVPDLIIVKGQSC